MNTNEWDRYYNEGGTEEVKIQFINHISDVGVSYPKDKMSEMLEYIHESGYVDDPTYEYLKDPSNKEEFAEISKQYYDTIMNQNDNSTDSLIDPSSEIVEEYEMDSSHDLKDEDLDDSFNEVSNKISSGFSNIVKSSGNAIYVASEFIKLYGLNNTLKESADGINKDINALIDGINTNFVLSPETIGKLNDDVSGLFYGLKKNIDSILTSIDNVSRNVLSRKKGASEVDSETGEEIDGATPIITIPDSGNSGRRNRKTEGSQNVEEQNPLDEGTQEASEKPVEDNQPIEDIVVENKELIEASIGSLVFQSGIILFTTIGGEQVTANSETEYGVIGIEKVNDELYLKIIDKKTGKIYFVKSENVNANIDNKIVHVKENALLLNSTNVDADNSVVKLIEPDSYYISVDNQESDGIEFAKVLNSDGKDNYYIPISESVEVLSFNEIITNLNEGINDNYISSTNDNSNIVEVGEK